MAAIEAIEPLQDDALLASGARTIARPLVRTASAIAAVVAVAATLIAYAAFGVRGALALAVVPGVAASVAALRRQPAHAASPARVVLPPLREVVRGDTRLLILALAAFEMGNVATALLVLRAILVLTPEHGTIAAVELTLGLYAAHNAAALLAAAVVRRMRDPMTRTLLLGAGTVLFLVAYGVFALTDPGITLLLAAFVATGLGTGAVRAGERAAVRELVDEPAEEAAVGLLATMQAIGNFAAATATGVIWSEVSVRAALLYLGTWLLISSVGLFTAATRLQHPRR
jgi:predicted MFS family arabinose efflux permease